MSSPLVLIVALLKASPGVGALVADRIEPEVAHGSDYPRIVVPGRPATVPCALYRALWRSVRPA